MNESISADKVFIRKLTEIVLANLGNENFGVKELIRESGMSRIGLSRRLHALINKTIIQFISETRLQKALEMLNKSWSLKPVYNHDIYLHIEEVKRAVAGRK